MSTHPSQSVLNARSKSSSSAIRFTQRTVRSPLVNRFVALSLCIGTVLLVLFDWLFDFGLIALPIGKSLRAFLTIVFALYVVRTGVRFSAYGFPFGRVLAFYLVLCISYAIFSANMVDNLYYSVRILFWVLGTVVAYRLFISGALSASLLRKTIMATILFGAGFTIYFMTSQGVEVGQNASAYLLLWCLPLLLVVRKSWVSTFLFALAVVAILLTVKRGAIVGLGLSMAVYALIYMKIHSSTQAFMKTTGAVVTLGILVAYIVGKNWGSLAMRFSDTTGSGRINLYDRLLNHWLDAEPLNLIFGFGIQSVKTFTQMIFFGSKGLYAHSDWLQLGHDFGFLGIGFLVWLHVIFLSLIRRSYKLRHPITPSLTMGYVILFLVNIYSGQLMSPDAIYIGLLLAFASARISSAEQSQRFAGRLLVK